MNPGEAFRQKGAKVLSKWLARAERKVEDVEERKRQAELAERHAELAKLQAELAELAADKTEQMRRAIEENKIAEQKALEEACKRAEEAEARKRAEKKVENRSVAPPPNSTKLQNSIEKIGGNVLLVPANGACLFNSLVASLGAHPGVYQQWLYKTTAEELRELAVKEFSKRPHKYISQNETLQVHHDGKLYKNLSVEEYARRMAMPNAWGDDIIVQVLACIVDTNICLVSDQLHFPEYRMYPGGPRALETVHIAYDGKTKHFSGICIRPNAQQAVPDTNPTNSWVPPPGWTKF